MHKLKKQIADMKSLTLYRGIAVSETEV